MMSKPSKILIVDDDPGIHELLLAFLSSPEYEITSASDGPQALEQIEAERFDLVLLDLMLPGPDGIDILKHIRERQIESEVIVITAHASMETAIEALQLGAYDYVSKPLQIDAIRSTVKRAVEKRLLEEKLTTIHDLSREMALSLNVDHVVETVLDVIERVLEFHTCSIGLTDEERNELYVLARYGAEQDELHRLPLNTEKRIAVAVARDGKSLYVPNVREDSRYVESRAETRSELAVPLRAKNRVIGVLSVESSEVDAFGQNDLQLVSTLAAQTSVAIENARLYEQARQEIMERERAEKALRESGERFRDVALSTSDWVWEVDVQGHYTYCSGRVADVLGYTTEEMLGKTLFDLMPPDEATRVSKIFEEIARKREPILDLENWNISKEGHRVCLLTNGVPVLNEEGTLVGYRGVDKDITRRKQTEDGLIESEQKFRSIVEQFSDAIILMDERGAIVEWNKSAERILEIERDKAMGQFIWDIQFQLFPEEHRTPTTYQHTKANVLEFHRTGRLPQPQHQWAEQRIQRPDGMHRFIQISTFPIKTNTGFMSASIIRDTTEYVEANQEIKQRNRELVALNEIIQAINSTLDLQETLTFITDHTIRLMDVEASSLLLYDKANKDLWFAAATGIGSDFIVGQRLALGQGIAGWVAQHGEPALVLDMSKDPRWFGGFDKDSGFASRSTLCVPLYGKDQIIGTLSALNKKNGTFTEEDLRPLNALAASAVTAIENAQLFEQVQAGREKLKALSHHLVDAQEAERSRVARELHDETGQALSSLLLSLSLLEMEVDRPEVILARVTDLENMVDEMLENLHRLAMNLRPASLDLLGLVPALEHHVELFGRQHDINTQFAAMGLGDKRLPSSMETAIYRIVQEALTNVVRHAHASRVDVLLEQRDDQIVTIIEDDGIGFDSEAVAKGGRLGLFGIRERAEMLGGTLTIESVAATGTTILVEIPNVKPEV